MRYIIPLLVILSLFSCKTKKDETNISCIKTLAQTFPQPNGNRCAEPTGLLNSEALEVSLSGKPVWIVGTEWNDHKLWAVALEDGTVELIKTKNGSLISQNKKWKKIQAGAPPVLGVNCDDKPILVNEFTKETAPFAAPIVKAEAQSRGFRSVNIKRLEIYESIIDKDCRLFLWTTNEFLPEAYSCVLLIFVVVSFQG